ncbi:ABC transporter permease [Baekduia soli]|uniref:ABC transporter permease n=1 Tax=Baekduia soli TaxID=496014 RepID=A0A5B8UBH1_9ACTN|nr:ABC transporter permease [Baekduia soli]QEC50559.1 ABC transporter permease [Baekduia soli]
MSEVATSSAHGGPGAAGDEPRLSTVGNLVRLSRVDRFGAVYVLVAIVVLFSALAPDTFPTWDTAKSILNENATIAIIALALVVPLSTGVFDLSIGNVVALITVTVAWLVVEKHVGIGLALVIAVAMGVCVGAINALIVVGVGIDSFIATLGSGAVLQAVNLLISNEETVTSPHLNTELGKIATANVAGIQVPVLVAIAVALVLWWLLEHTVTGRRLYATGFNPEAARLAGVRTKRLRSMGLLVSAFVAGIAGIMVVARVGAGSPDVGPSYLLDAFAAAFLGATQIRNGRFNAWGTIIAVLVLGAGTNGLTQIGAAAWTLQMYTGVVLLAALALTRIERTQIRAGKATPHGGLTAGATDVPGEGGSGDGDTAVPAR